MSAYSIALTYAALSVPFIFSGIVVSIALTQFPRQVSALYGADLAGAALGCVLVGPVLRLTDAPDGRAGHGGGRRARRGAVCRGAAVAPAQSAPAPPLRCCWRWAHPRTRLAARRNAPWIRLVWVKGQFEARPLVEKWNSFSRVRVIGNPDRPVKPSGWGLSATLPAGLTTRELHLDIDSVRRDGDHGVPRRSGGGRAPQVRRHQRGALPASVLQCDRRRDRRRPRHPLRPGVQSAGGHRRRDQREHHRPGQRPVRRLLRPSGPRPAGAGSSTTKRGASSHGRTSAPTSFRFR